MGDIPAGYHREQGDQSTENHKRSRESVGREGPFQADGRKPADPFDQLELATERIKLLAEHNQHQHEVDKQDPDGQVAWHR